MSQLASQNEPLLSGWVAKAFDVSVEANTPQTLTLPINGVGGKLDAQGAPRYVPSPFLLLWAGLRGNDFLPIDGAGQFDLLIQLGIRPYRFAPNSPTRTELAPSWAPFGTQYNSDGTPNTNIFTQWTVIPWPLGSLSVRFSMEWRAMNPLGTQVEAWVTWCAASWPSYPSLPLPDGDVMGLGSRR